MVEENNSRDPVQHNAEQPQPSGQTSSTGGSGQNWKTALFVVVILVAGAVAGHSLLKSDRPNQKGGLCGGDAACASCPLSKGAQEAKPCEIAAQGAVDKSDSEGLPCCEQQACPSNEKACCPDSVCPAASAPSTAQPAGESCSGCPFAAGGSGGEDGSK